MKEQRTFNVMFKQAKEMNACVGKKCIKTTTNLLYYTELQKHYKEKYKTHISVFYFDKSSQEALKLI